ncbi:MAG TPA: addiction module protein [Opitutaceae bacterium]
MSTAEIQKMTTHERLVAMEQLWDALCNGKTEPASPAWHEAVLAKRKEKMNSAEARFFTLEQIREQFR